MLLNFVLYRSCQIPGGVTFTVDSDLNRENPRLTLTCTSTGSPATTVTWTRDAETVSGGMTVLDDSVTAQYTHTLTVALTLQWVALSNSEVASGSGPSLTHTLDPARTSDAGQYTCQATVDIPSVGVSVTGQSSTTLTVQNDLLNSVGTLVTSLCIVNSVDCLHDPSG